MWKIKSQRIYLLNRTNEMILRHIFPCDVSSSSTIYSNCLQLWVAPSSLSCIALWDPSVRQQQSQTSREVKQILLFFFWWIPGVDGTEQNKRQKQFRFTHMEFLSVLRTQTPHSLDSSQTRLHLVLIIFVCICVLCFPDHHSTTGQFPCSLFHFSCLTESS